MFNSGEPETRLGEIPDRFAPIPDRKLARLVWFYQPFLLQIYVPIITRHQRSIAEQDWVD